MSDRQPKVVDEGSAARWKAKVRPWRRGVLKDKGEQMEDACVETRIEAVDS